MKKVLIVGGSGFIGHTLYKELSGFLDTYGTYFTAVEAFESNQKFYPYSMEEDPIEVLLNTLKPHWIISALRGNFNAQWDAHDRMIRWVKKNPCRLMFLSSANVFDNFHNYPSYEFDKTFSESSFGRLKITIENALLRLPNMKYSILRVPMVYGRGSPRVQELKSLYGQRQSIEVFPHVVINATTIDKLAQQIHYIINRGRRGIFHLGSIDLIHHHDLIRELCAALGLVNPIFKQIFSTNDDRFLAVLPRDNMLPQNLQIRIQEIIQAHGPI